MENDDLSQKEKFVQSYFAADRINPLRLYYVRIHNTKDDLHLQADFGKKIVFEFDRQHQLDHTNNSSTFVYTLDLQLKKETSGQLQIYHDSRWKSINRFHMQYVGPSLFKFGTTTYNEKDDQGHVLDGYFGSDHYFLFDVQFNSKLAHDCPGKKLSKR